MLIILNELFYRHNCYNKDNPLKKSAYNSNGKDDRYNRKTNK